MFWPETDENLWKLIVIATTVINSIIVLAFLLYSIMGKREDEFKLNQETFDEFGHGLKEILKDIGHKGIVNIESETNTYRVTYEDTSPHQSNVHGTAEHIKSYGEPTHKSEASHRKEKSVDRVKEKNPWYKKVVKELKNKIRPESSHSESEGESDSESENPNWDDVMSGKASAIPLELTEENALEGDMGKIFKDNNSSYWMVMEKKTSRTEIKL